MFLSERNKGEVVGEVRMKILNSFSLNMVAAFPAVISVEEISLGRARDLAKDVESFVGHVDTAAVFSQQLGVEVLAHRGTVSMVNGESVLVGQYRGPRMPEGAKTLPEGATIQWCIVTLQ